MSAHASPALAPPVTVRPSVMAPVRALAWREVVRFVRQPARVAGALATPIVFWLLIGGGVGTAFVVPGGDGAARGTYLQYFFPGTVLMILLFTAIFATISIIEDRREGFLQSVLVAPVPRLSIVLGKVFGGAGLALAQAAAFLLLAPLAGVPLTWGGVALALIVMAVLAIGLTALGVCIAWPMGSTQGFHAVMNLLLMPMWFLSGALFPASTAWPGLRAVMLANPLTWGLDALRQALHDGPAALGSTRWWISSAVATTFAVAMLLLAARIADRRGEVARG